jgi:hypothetical protein
VRTGGHLPGATALALARRPGARIPSVAARHLTNCLRCRQDVEDLRRLVEALRYPAPEPPAGVIARAWALVEPRAPRGERHPRFLLARLVYDSGLNALATGLRGPVATRHRVWRTRRADVDVRVESAGLGSAATLVGQILPRTPLPSVPRGGTAWLREGARRPRWAVISPSGEFSLPAPRSDRWVLRLTWDGLHLLLEAEP